MKCAFVLTILSIFLAYASGADYVWGETGKNDLLIAKDKVKEAFFVGLVVTEKYVFKQKDLDAPTITSVRVTDQMSKNGATAELIYGGPGSKGATIFFKSQRGHSIKSLVEIYGR